MDSNVVDTMLYLLFTKCTKELLNLKFWSFVYKFHCISRLGVRETFEILKSNFLYKNLYKRSTKMKRLTHMNQFDRQ